MSTSNSGSVMKEEEEEVDLNRRRNTRGSSSSSSAFAFATASDDVASAAELQQQQQRTPPTKTKLLPSHHRGGGGGSSSVAATITPSSSTPARSVYSSSQPTTPTRPSSSSTSTNAATATATAQQPSPSLSSISSTLTAMTSSPSPKKNMIRQQHHHHHHHHHIQQQQQQHRSITKQTIPSSLLPNTSSSSSLSLSLYHDIAIQYDHAYKAWNVNNIEMSLSYLERCLALALSSPSESFAIVNTSVDIKKKTKQKKLVDSKMKKIIQKQQQQQLIGQTYYWLGYVLLYKQQPPPQQQQQQQQEDPRDHHQSSSSSSTSSSNDNYNIINIQKSIQYFLKSTRIRIAIYGDNHPKTQQSFDMLQKAVTKLSSSSIEQQKQMLLLPQQNLLLLQQQQQQQQQHTTSQQLLPANIAGGTGSTDDGSLDYVQSLKESLMYEKYGDDSLLHNSHDYYEALFNYKKSIENFPDINYGPICGKLGYCYQHLGGQIELAVLWYRRALKAFLSCSCININNGYTSTTIISSLGGLGLGMGSPPPSSSSSSSVGKGGGTTTATATTVDNNKKNNNNNNNNNNNDDSIIGGDSSTIKKSYYYNDIKLTIQRLLDVLSATNNNKSTTDTTGDTTKNNKDWYSKVVCDSVLLEWEADQLFLQQLQQLSSMKQKQQQQQQQQQEKQREGDNKHQAEVIKPKSGLKVMEKTDSSTTGVVSPKASSSKSGGAQKQQDEVVVPSPSSNTNNNNDDDDKNEVLRELAIQKYLGSLVLEGRVWGHKHLVCVQLKEQINQLLKMQKTKTPNNTETKLDDEGEEETKKKNKKKTDSNSKTQRLNERLLQCRQICENLKEKLYQQRTISEKSAEKRLSNHHQQEHAVLSPLSEMEEIESDIQEFNLCKKRSIKARSLVVLLDSTIGEAISMVRTTKVTESRISSTTGSYDDDEEEQKSNIADGEHQFSTTTMTMAASAAPSCDESMGESSTTTTTSAPPSPSQLNQEDTKKKGGEEVASPVEEGEEGQLNLSKLADRIQWFVTQCRILHDISQGHDDTLLELKVLGGMIEYTLVQSQLVVERKSSAVDQFKQEYHFWIKEKRRVVDESEQHHESAKELRAKISEIYVQMNDLKAATAGAKSSPTLKLSSPFKRKSRSVIEQPKQDDEAVSIRSLQSEYSALEGRLKAVNEGMGDLRREEREVISQIEEAESALSETESQLDQARKEQSSIKASYVVLSGHIKRLHTSRLATEALLFEAQKELQYLRQEEGGQTVGDKKLFSDIAGWMQEKSEDQPGSAGTNDGPDRLLKEAEDCVSNLKAGIERLTVRAKDLRAEQSGRTRQTKVMEKTKIHMDMALFKTNEGIDSSRAECEAILERFSRIERQELQLKDKLQRFETGINTIMAEAMMEGAATNEVHDPSAASNVTGRHHALQDAEKNAIEVQAARAALSARSQELDLAYEQSEMRLQQALDQIRNLEKLVSELETKLKEKCSVRDSLRSKLPNTESKITSGVLTDQVLPFEMTSQLMADAMAKFSTDSSSVSGSSIATEDLSLSTGMGTEGGAMSILEGTLPEAMVIDQEGQELLMKQIEGIDAEIEELQLDRDRLHKKIRNSQQIVSISSIDKKSLEADKSELSSQLSMLEKGTLSPGKRNSQDESMTGIRDTQILVAELEGKLRASEIELDLIRRELENSHSLIANNEAISESLKELISEASEASKYLTESLANMSENQASPSRARKASANSEDRSSSSVDKYESLRHEMKTIVIAKDFLALIISRLADYRTTDAANPVKTAEKTKEAIVVEKAKGELKVAALEISKVAIEKQLENGFESFKKLSSQKSEEQARHFKATTHIHDIEEARARVSNDSVKSDEALKEARDNIRALETALAEREEQLKVLDAAWGQLQKLKADKEASSSSSDSADHFKASQSALAIRLEECKAEAFKYQTELSLSSKIAAGLELSNQRVKNQQVQVDKQLSSMVAAKSKIEARMQMINQDLLSVEKGREGLPFQLAECLKELDKSKADLDQQSKVIARKDTEIDNLKRLVNLQEKGGGTGYRMGMEYEIDLRSAEKDIFRLKSELKRLKKKKEYVGSTSMMLKLQNRIATRLVDETSNELTETGEKLQFVEKRYEELQELFTSLEKTHETLKTTLHEGMKAADALIGGGGDGTSQKTAAVVKTPTTSPVTVMSRGVQLTTLETLQSGQESEKDNDDLLLEPYVKSVQCIYNSKSVSYLVRRPRCLNGREQTLFQEASPFDDRKYCEKANVQDPSTIEILAKISHDGSQFFLSGRSTVRYRGKGGLWENAGDTDTLDKPLGWVSYTNKRGEREYYSLDEILEVTRIYRQHYCESFLLQSRWHRTAIDNNKSNKLVLLFHQIKIEILFFTCFREEAYSLNEVLLVGAVIVLTLSLTLPVLAQRSLEWLITFLSGILTKIGGNYLYVQM